MKPSAMIAATTKPGARVAVVPAPSTALDPLLEQQFLEAYHRIHAPARDHAEHFLDPEDARDAFGDAVLVLLRRWPTLTPGQRSDKWMLGVVHRCVKAKLRENRPYVPYDDAEVDILELPDPADDAATPTEAAALLDVSLARMPLARREVLLLIREHDFTYAETAEALGVTIGTINSQIHRATDDLRAAFARAGFRIERQEARRLLAPKEGSIND